jgi:hypothetical protein
MAPFIGDCDTNRMTGTSCYTNTSALVFDHFGYTLYKLYEIITRQISNKQLALKNSINIIIKYASRFYVLLHVAIISRIIHFFSPGILPLFR